MINVLNALQEANNIYHTDPQRMGKIQTWALLEGLNNELESSSHKILRINFNEAQHYNNAYYGIFHTVNSFLGKRQKKFLIRVNAWFCEVDSEDKNATLKLINNSPLAPTMVIESKRGFHIYWACIDSSLEKCISSWDRIMKRGIIPHFNGDKKASDICRILRTPGFNHWKDRSNPFMIKKLFDKKIGYTVSQMEKAFPDMEKDKIIKKEFRQAIKKSEHSEDFWQNVYNLDCEMALEKLSGTDYVSQNTFSFRDHNDGTKQILVDNKSTSCWIDVNKKIGSYDEGGPSIGNYLHWYHKDWKKVASIIQEVFPECKTQKQMTLI